MHAMDLDDAYRVERVLARGAGGVTEIVTLGESGPFVRKSIPSKLARRGVWGTLAECDSARLPHVIATYEMPDEFVVVCDFVPGENLEQLLSARGRLAETDATRLVVQLCEAAAALHAHGIIHRDISPTNVIVAADGAHLIDLGIARFRAEGATHDTTQLGTPGFAAPEQHGFAQTDARTDVYSLGRVLGYLLTGVRPEMPDAAEYEQALADEKIVSPQMRVIVERASAFEPSARYQSAAELARALGAEMADAAASATGSTATAMSGTEDDAESDVKGPAMTGSSHLPVVKVALCAALLIGLVGAIVLFVIDAVSGNGSTGGRTDGSDGGESEGSISALFPDMDDLADGNASAGAGTGQNGSHADGASTQNADEKPLEVVEFGWSADPSGYISYAFGLRNNANTLIEYPAVTVTGRDADGSVLFSDDWVVSEVAAGETGYFASIAGNGTAPATVEITPIAPDDYQYTSLSEARAVFSVSGAREVSDGFGGIQFVGEVTTEKDGGSTGMGQVILSVVLRDESGQIIYGASGFADRPAVGETTSFAIDAFGAPRDYASFEVYACPW